MIPKWIRKDLLYHWPTKEYFESILTVVEEDDNKTETTTPITTPNQEEMINPFDALNMLFGGGDPTELLKSLGASDEEIKSIMTEQEPNVNKPMPCEGSVVQIEDIREQYQKENK